MNNWYTRAKPEDNQGLVIEEETGKTVAVSYDPKDAKLIAAAPELLESLTKLMQHCTYMCNMQKLGQEILPVDWTELNRIANDSRRIVYEFEE